MFQYQVDDPPRVVLDKLENFGYAVVGMTGLGQTAIWTLHKSVASTKGEMDISFYFFVALLSLVRQGVFGRRIKVGVTFDGTQQIRMSLPTKSELAKSAATNSLSRTETCSWSAQNLATYDDSSMTGNCSYLLENVYLSGWSPTKKQEDWFNSLSIKRQSTSTKRPRVHREMRSVTKDEFQDLVSVLWRLKTDLIDGVSKWDIMRMMHGYYEALADHRTITFIQWHREFMVRLDAAVEEISAKTIPIPYWDLTLDSSLNSYASQAVTWSNKLLSTNIGPVSKGNFGHWPLNSKICQNYTDNLSYLYRYMAFAPDQPSGYIDDDDLTTLFSFDSFRGLSEEYLPCFLFVHNNIHDRIGGAFDGHGTDDYFNCVFDDPIFVFFHTMIDYVFDAFRTSQKTSLEQDYKYHSSKNYTLEWCTMAYATMYPFLDLNVLDGFGMAYEKVRTYEIRPYACLVNADCGSDYLICSSEQKTCTSKIKTDGRCNGAATDSKEVCYQSRCVNGVCKT